MKVVTLGLIFFQGLALESTWALGVCAQEVARSAFSAQVGYLSEDDLELPLILGKNVFDIRGRAAELLNTLGVSGALSAYGCTSARAEGFCLMQLQSGNWATRGSLNGNFQSKVSKNDVKLESVLYGSAGGDPWFGLGASRWRDDWTIRFNTQSLQFSSTFLDGRQTSWGFRKKTTLHGTCVVERPMQLQLGLEQYLRKAVVSKMVGVQDIQNGLTVPAVGPANVNLFGAGSKMFLATGVSLEKNTVDLLDLESRSHRSILVDELAAFRAFGTPEVFSRVAQQGRDVDQAFLTRGKSRRWSCLSRPNDLFTSKGQTQEVEHLGYTIIEMVASRSAPGSELGYLPLAQGRILLPGFESSLRKPVFSNGLSRATLILSPRGESLVVRELRLSKFESLKGIPRSTMTRDFGIDADSIAFGDWLCFSQ